MAYVRSRGRRAAGDIWPGFVDAMATLLLVLTFLLSMFMISQYFVTREASSKDTALKRLMRQISGLTELLALEKGKKASIEEELASLTASLVLTKSENTRLHSLVGTGSEKARSVATRMGELKGKFSAQAKISAQALAQVELLNRQILALRRQITALGSALDASETRDKKSKTRIADLGRRLNVALARKVQELSRYRSDFFGRLRGLLKGRKDIRIVGDRFVFQAEVLFPSGSAAFNPEGVETLRQLAGAIKELEKEIPKEINWVLRVDGHTDVRPIRTPEFLSNWELSTARAISVVRYLIAQGVAPRHLMAAGFGEFQPLDPGTSEAALRRNRRIELKLTTR